MRVGLTGATGHLGGVLLGRLVAAPEVTSITSVARRPLPPAGHRVRYITADLRSPEARRALTGVDLCYHLAFQLWTGGDPAAMAAANRDATANVVAARPAAVVLASSAAVYGAHPDNPLPLTEDHRPRPNPEVAYASHKLDAERRCLDAGPTVALRLAAVLGPHADRAVARSVAGYRLAVPAVRGVRQAVQFLHEDDAAGAFLAAGRLLSGGGPSSICNVATGDWLGEAEVAALAGSRVVRLPRRLLLAVAETGRRARLAPFGADRAALLGGPLALDPSRAAAVLGWTPSATSADVLARQLGVRPAPQSCR